VKRQTEQVIDEITQDELLHDATGFSAEAREKARSVMAEFTQFVRDHKNDIEAIQILYSRPFKAGLRFKQVKDLATRLHTAPFHVDPKKPDSVGHLWHCAEAAEQTRWRRVAARAWPT